jgi:plasmid stabilization system protein ParE
MIAFEVSFSRKAETDFEDILNYIAIQFGEQSVVNFKKLVLDFATLLEQFPEIGSIEIRNKNIRGFVVHRRLKVFYRINNNKVIVLRLFDTRQHPSKS